MDKQQFLDACYEQLILIFSNAKERQKDDKQKHRTEGFIEAGKYMGVINAADAQDLMERAHMQVFDESIQARQQRQASLHDAIKEGDDSYLNIPAYERRRTK